MTGRSLHNSLYYSLYNLQVLQRQKLIIISTSAYRYSQYKLVEKQIMIFFYRVNCVSKHQLDTSIQSSNHIG